MLANATHFNCRFSMFNAQLQTRALDLTKYVDPNAGFIVHKSLWAEI
jgi:hypothetical protein